MDRPWVVLTAAGSGSRLGAQIPKALVPVGGKTILVRALEKVLAVPNLAGVVVTAPGEEIVQFQTLVDSLEPTVPVVVVSGGATRAQSVTAALDAVQDAVAQPRNPMADFPILVHDAARCETPPEVFARVTDAISQGDKAVIPVLPVTDTIVEVFPNGQQVARNLERSALRAVQTPQGFSWQTLRAAHERAREDGTLEAATDDASLVAAMGVPVTTVPGSEKAFKVTVRADLRHLLD